MHRPFGFHIGLLAIGPYGLPSPPRTSRGGVVFGVVEEGEGFAFDEPGDAEEQQEEYLQNHGVEAGGFDDAYQQEDHFERQHAVAADAVYLVANFFALGHGLLRLGELKDAVERDGHKEEGGTSGVDVVGNFYRHLEEADGGAVGDPADFAWEQDDAKSGDAGGGGEQVVHGVVADVGDEHDARGHEHAHQSGALVVCGGDAPPPVFAGAACDAGREERQPG